MKFSEAKEIGNWGEWLFEQYLKWHNVEYTDVTNNPEYFSKDIDFIADGIKYEIKTDTWYRRTGNIPVEDIHYYYADGTDKGWYHYTEADYLVYAIPPQEGSAAAGTLIFITLGNLKKIIKYDRPQQKSHKDVNKETYNWLIHVADYPEMFHIQDVYIF